MEKRFGEWINVKQRLHETPRQPPMVTNGDIWWISVGENVGHEIDGKSKKFSRPAVIYRKLSRELFLVLPTTTQPRQGSWYVKIRHKDADSYVCLHQARTIDYRRLWTRIGSTSEEDAKRIRGGFQNLFG